MTILAAHAWRTNAELIADVASLGYISDTDRVCDLTYGKGVWWRQFRPNDLEISWHDFRSTPYADAAFDVVAYDPPYVCVGGRKTSTLGEMNERYGLHDELTPTSPAALQDYINAGLTEAARIVKPRGFVLAKCADYISSGKLWPGIARTRSHAEACGLEIVEAFYMVGKPRPQPARAVQVHARQNLSVLLVGKRLRQESNLRPSA